MTECVCVMCYRVVLVDVIDDTCPACKATGSLIEIERDDPVFAF